MSKPSPVLRYRPVRADRFFTQNVPNPLTPTVTTLAKASRTASDNPFAAAYASDLDSETRLATSDTTPDLLHSSSPVTGFGDAYARNAPSLPPPAVESHCALPSTDSRDLATLPWRPPSGRQSFRRKSSRPMPFPATPGDGAQLKSDFGQP